MCPQSHAQYCGLSKGSQQITFQLFQCGCIIFFKYPLPSIVGHVLCVCVWPSPRPSPSPPQLVHTKGKYPGVSSCIGCSGLLCRSFSLWECWWMILGGWFYLSFTPHVWNQPYGKILYCCRVSFVSHPSKSNAAEAWICVLWQRCVNAPRASRGAILFPVEHMWVNCRGEATGAPLVALLKADKDWYHTMEAIA